MRDELRGNEAALLAILSLLDQLYDMRRRMRELRDALHENASEEGVHNVAGHMAEPMR